MRRFYTLLLVSSSLAVAGCMPVVAGVATPMIIQQKHVNLTNASYAAADTISQQAGKRFSKDRPLVVSDLREIPATGQTKPVPSPKVGQVISSQMRDRFTQLGYKVVDSPANQVGGAAGQVGGTYEFVHGTMVVSLKMLDAGTGETITLHNYSLPMTYDIKKYMAGNANMLPPLF